MPSPRLGLSMEPVGLPAPLCPHRDCPQSGRALPTLGHPSLPAHPSVRSSLTHTDLSQEFSISSSVNYQFMKKTGKWEVNPLEQACSDPDTFDLCHKALSCPLTKHFLGPSEQVFSLSKCFNFDATMLCNGFPNLCLALKEMPSAGCPSAEASPAWHSLTFARDEIFATIITFQLQHL